MNVNGSIIISLCACSQSSSGSIIAPTAPRILQTGIASFYVFTGFNRTSVWGIGPCHTLTIRKGNDISVGIHATLHIVAPHAHFFSTIVAACFGGARWVKVGIIIDIHIFVVSIKRLDLTVFHGNTFSTIKLPHAVRFRIAGPTIVEITAILSCCFSLLSLADD